MEEDVKKTSIIGFKADKEHIEMIQELIKAFESEFVNSPIQVKVSSSDVLRYAVRELYNRKVRLKEKGL
jgi:hypothetical protein